MTYKDKTFCAAECGNHQCDRQFTERTRLDAIRWWGAIDPPISFADFSSGCSDYQPINQPPAT